MKQNSKYAAILMIHSQFKCLQVWSLAQLYYLFNISTESNIVMKIGMVMTDSFGNMYTTASCSVAFIHKSDEILKSILPIYSRELCYRSVFTHKSEAILKSICPYIAERFATVRCLHTRVIKPIKTSFILQHCHPVHPPMSYSRMLTDATKVLMSL